MSNESKRLMDKVGVMGLDDTEYPQEEHITTIDVEYLKSAMVILDELGWTQIDVCAIPSEEADYPMLRLKPPHESFFGGENAGIAITPKTEKGRNDE